MQVNCAQKYKGGVLREQEKIAAGFVEGGRGWLIYRHWGEGNWRLVRVQEDFARSQFATRAERQG